jgi:Tetratricopeptide repeat
MARRGELDEAQRLHEKALAGDPGNVVHRIMLGKFLAWSRNDPCAARQLYREGLARHPGNQYLERALQEAPDEEYCRRRIRAEPDNAVARHEGRVSDREVAA